MARAEEATEEVAEEIVVTAKKRPKTSKPDLNRAARFSDEERFSEAAEILGVPKLTAAQEDVIRRVHNVGSEGRGYHTYTQREITEKRRILETMPGFKDLPREVKADLSRKLMENGIVGSLPTEPIPFSQILSEIGRTHELRSRLTVNGSNVTVEKVTDQYKLIGQGYEAEALKLGSALHTKPAWEFYARAGDKDASLRMVESGIKERGMSPDAVIKGLNDKITTLSAEVASKKNPALVVELNTLKSVRDEVRARVASQALVKPSQSSQAQAPSLVPVRSVAAVTPSQARSLANDYRRGVNGKTVDLKQSAELYYKASDGVIQSEIRRTRGFQNGESRFMDNNDFSSAFMHSLESDGELAIKMLEDIRDASGAQKTSALNSFLYENAERFNSPHRNPLVRANFRKFIDHVEKNYVGDLYSVQRNYLRSWKSAQYLD